MAEAYVWKKGREKQKGQRGDQLHPERIVVSSGNITRYYWLWGK